MISCAFSDQFAVGRQTAGIDLADLTGKIYLPQ